MDEYVCRNRTMCAVVVLSAIGLAVLSSCAEDAEKKSSEADMPANEWSAFSKGSWITIRTVSTRGERTKSKTEKLIFVRQAEAGPVVDVYPFDEGVIVKRPTSMRTIYSGFSPDSALNDVDLANNSTVKFVKKAKILTAEIIVSKEKYKCTVHEFQMSDSKSGFVITYTLWTSKKVKVPVRSLSCPGELGFVPPILMGTSVLRAEILAKSARGIQKSSFQVVAFGKTQTIGTRKLVCIREDGAFSVSVPDKKGMAVPVMAGREHRFISVNVLGHKVLSVRELTTRGKKEKAVWRVVDFGRPRKK